MYQTGSESRNRVMSILLITGLLFFFASGCHREIFTKHEVLTFFFTGVEPPGGEKEEGNAFKVKEKEKSPIKKFEFYVHGPRAAQQCEICHQKSKKAGVKKRDRESGGFPRLGETMPGKVAEMRNLCTECHTSKSVKSAVTRGLWLHGALVNGNCLYCHHYHQSRYPYMLLRETSMELCVRCHAEGFISKTEEHMSGEDCISCHNPHVGSNRFLLRKDFNEVF